MTSSDPVHTATAPARGVSGAGGSIRHVRRRVVRGAVVARLLGTQFVATPDDELLPVHASEVDNRAERAGGNRGPVTSRELRGGRACDRSSWSCLRRRLDCAATLAPSSMCDRSRSLQRQARPRSPTADNARRRRRTSATRRRSIRCAREHRVGAARGTVVRELLEELLYVAHVASPASAISAQLPQRARRDLPRGRLRTADDVGRVSIRALLDHGEVQHRAPGRRPLQVVEVRRIDVDDVTGGRPHCAGARRFDAHLAPGSRPRAPSRCAGS